MSLDWLLLSASGQQHEDAEVLHLNARFWHHAERAVLDKSPGLPIDAQAEYLFSEVNTGGVASLITGRL